ncbi:MAG TPA: TetR family transcriptional regulator [Myxococcota bacterium]|nr:TetR family transcriptional regulator [Myxococcota bacterium]
MSMAELAVKHRPSGARPGARRKLALAAARAIAAEGGYDAVTMREVAVRSGVARATLYRYFSSKDHLLAEVILAMNAELREELRIHPPVGADPAERVTEAFARVLAMATREPKLLAATLRAFFSHDPAARAAELEIRRMSHAYLEAGLGDAHVAEREEIARVLSPICFAMLLSLSGGRRTYEEAVDDIRCAVRLMLKTPAPTV